MDLVRLVETAIEGGRFETTTHARARLRDRKVELWQVEVGIAEWEVIEQRPGDLPNPSIVTKQLLPDGTEFFVVWAWNAEEKPYSSLFSFPIEASKT